MVVVTKLRAKTSQFKIGRVMKMANFRKQNAFGRSWSAFRKAMLPATGKLRRSQAYRVTRALSVRLWANYPETPGSRGIGWSMRHWRLPHEAAVEC